MLQMIITVLVFAAIFTAWAFWTLKYGKYRGGCGSCQMLQGCCQNVDEHGNAAVHPDEVGLPKSQDNVQSAKPDEA